MARLKTMHMTQTVPEYKVLRCTVGALMLAATIIKYIEYRKNKKPNPKGNIFL